MMQEGKKPESQQASPDAKQSKIEKWSFKFDNIIFDMDSTLSQVEGLDILAEVVARATFQNEEDVQKFLKEFKDTTKKGMGGKIPFNESLMQRMDMLPTKPTREQIIKTGEEIGKKITESFLKNKEFFEKYKDNIYIISGGFREMILPSTRALGINDEHVYANEFIYDEKGVVVGIDESKLTSQTGGKAKQFIELNLQGDTVVIGDGATDLEIKTIGGADTFIVYTQYENTKERKNVIEQSDARAESFEEILEQIKK